MSSAKYGIAVINKGSHVVEELAVYLPNGYR